MIKMIFSKQLVIFTLLLNTVSILSRILKPSELKPKLIVNTTSGLIQGSEAGHTGNNRTIYKFRGIPYAEPPIGDLRFEVKQIFVSLIYGKSHCNLAYLRNHF